MLNALDKAKTKCYIFAAIIISVMGFFTYAYDMFYITTIVKMLERIYCYDPMTGKPKSLSPNVLTIMNSISIYGTFVGVGRIKNETCHWCRRRATKELLNLMIHLKKGLNEFNSLVL